jgi:hypothetical protein
MGVLNEIRCNNETSVKKLLYDYSLFLRQVHDENNEM